MQIINQFLISAGRDGAALQRPRTGHQPAICSKLQGLLSKHSHVQDKNNLFCNSARGVKLELLDLVLLG